MAPPRLLRLLAFVVLATTCAVAPAAAQGWFSNLFGGFAPRPRQGAPSYPGYGGGGGNGGGGGGGGSSGYAPRATGGGTSAPTADDVERSKPRHHAQKRRASPPKEDVAKAVPPKNASMFVYVFGDSLGQMLADGLDDALSDRPDVAVVHKAKGSTGLVARDYYDWPKAIDEMLGGGKEAVKDDKAVGDKQAKGDAGKADKKPEPASKDTVKAPHIDVAVMMIGTNDKQSIREDGKTLAFATPEWTDAYTKRVVAIDEAFRSHGIPLIWVGIPITKDDHFADAMASLNDITREAAAKTGAVYVDTWEAFSDDNGDFSAVGPDVNGQTVRLRSSDGIHFTRAGARKLAHFVDTHVRRALDGKTPAPQLPTAETSDVGGKPVAAAKPDAGPIRNLNEVPDSKDGTLATLPAKNDAVKRDALVATTLVRGEAMPIPAGRADSARWPTQGAPEP